MRHTVLLALALADTGFPVLAAVAGTNPPSGTRVKIFAEVLDDQ